jgi:O-antigen ligase
MGLGVATIAASILLVGGAFRWTQAVIAALVAMATIAQLLSRRGLGRWSPLIVTLGTAAVVTALQLVPLPHGLLAQLQPVGSSLRDDGAAIAGVSPWRALTLDAPGSLRGLCFFLILLGVAWTALRLAVTEGGRYRVLASVAASCGFTAVVVGVHELFGATSLYGIYAPVQAKPSVLGPLLNENHLGGLMAIGATVALGLAMHRRQPSWARVLWLAVVGACGAVTVASESRGATLALIAGTMITGGFLLGQRLFGTHEQRRRSRERFMTTSLPIAVVAVCTIVVIVYASAGAVSAQLSRTSLAEIHQPKSKFAVWRSAAELIEESPWVGVGRGGFEPAFTRIHPAAAVASFSHVENEYVQAVVDWGLPFAICVGAGVVWIVVIAFRRWRDGPLIAGALGAITAIGLQSIVDFGIELLGIAVPVTAILATVAYVPLRPVEARALTIARASRIGLVVALIAACGLLLSSATTTIEEDHEALSGRTSVQLADLHDSIERHPLDYYGFALAAQIMMRDGDPHAVGTLNHAMRLHPTQPGLHHLAARMLDQAGHHEQAVIEYASAIRTSSAPRPLLAEVLSRFSVQQAASAIPLDIANSDDMLNALLERKRNDVATAWLLRVLDFHPGDRHACGWLVDAAIHDQSVDEATAASHRCADFAATESRIALAAVLLRNHRYDEVLQSLGDVERWPGRIDEKVTGWLLVCDTALARQRWDDAKRCLRRLDGSGYVPAERRGEIARRLEQVETGLRAVVDPDHR